MFDDDQAADALRAIVEAPEPPPTTTADQVIRLGRRRLRVRRAGAAAGLAAGVVALVTGIAMGSSLLTAPDGVDTAASRAVQPPPMTPSGWTKIDKTSEKCDFSLEPPYGPDLPLPAQGRVESALGDAVASATGRRYEPLVANWPEIDERRGEISGRLTGLVPTEAGPAVLELFVSSIDGSPDDASGVQLTRERCLPRYRTVLADGTVMLMSLRDDRKPTSADLDVYVPGGRRLAVHTVSGISTLSDKTHKRVTIEEAVDLPFAQMVEIGYELSQAGL